jgi:FlaA1/EpsC-like NDP-sugar epimerase
MFDFFLDMTRFNKRLVSLLADLLLISVSFWFSYWIRLDIETPFASNSHWLLLLSTALITMYCFVRLGLYRAVLRYVSFNVLLTVLAGTLASSFLLVTSAFIFDIFLPRSTAILYFSITFILIGGVRLFFRMVVYKLNKKTTPVLIYGAGASGRQLHFSLNQSSEYIPLAFVDDDVKMLGASIQGLRVHNPADISFLVERFSIDKILLALPSVAVSKRKEVLSLLEGLPCEVLSVPSMVDLVTGNAKIDQLKEVSIEDILGRDIIAPDEELMSKNITAKVVLVSGAAGSIGSELCRQIIKYQPSTLILLDHSEFGLYAIDKELKKLKETSLVIQIVPLLGSVQNSSRLISIFKKFAVNTVFHAAAYKHVPLVEYNTVEGIRNNVFGTLNCANAAIECNVDSFVLISTDKAVRPTNVMGASKRVAELILQALAKETKCSTIFSMVRFGNVLGSSGSVVPLFRSQIKAGGPVTVTHPEITRFFMTIPEASQLVIQAGSLGKGGDVFVLDMGESIKIADLASKMIHLSGYSIKDKDNLEGGIAVQFSGLRPGEKLYEELLIGSNVTGTTHDRIMTAQEDYLMWTDLKVILDDLDFACSSYNLNRVREILLNAPTGFKPSDGICDLVWNYNPEPKCKISNINMHG